MLLYQLHVRNKQPAIISESPPVCCIGFFPYSDQYPAWQDKMKMWTWQILSNSSGDALVKCNPFLMIWPTGGRNSSGVLQKILLEYEAECEIGGK